MKVIESIMLSFFLGFVNIMYLVQCACPCGLLSHFLAHIRVNAWYSTYCCIFILHQVWIYARFDAFYHDVSVWKCQPGIVRDWTLRWDKDTVFGTVVQKIKAYCDRSIRVAGSIDIVLGDNLGIVGIKSIYYLSWQQLTIIVFDYDCVDKLLFPEADSESHRVVSQGHNFDLGTYSWYSIEYFSDGWRIWRNKLRNES